MRILAGSMIACLIVAGCFRGDWWMYVANDTDHAVHLRVQEKPGSPDIYHVARVEPGADGPGVTWVGERDVPVEVLNAQCQLIGVLRTQDGTQYFVEELPGLTRSHRGVARRTGKPNAGHRSHSGLRW